MWLIFALSAALSDSAMDVIGKKGLENANFAPYTISWGLTFFGACFLFPFVCWLGFPSIDHHLFWIVLLLGSILNVFAFGNYFSSLQIADLSLIAPLTCLTPVFLLFISPLFLLLSGEDITNELPTLSGILGVCLIFVGSYILNINNQQKGYLEPIKSMFNNSGCRKAVLAAFIWSVTMSLSKVGIHCITSDNGFQKAIFWGCLLMFTISVFTIPFVIQEYRQSQENLKNNDNNTQTKSSNWRGWRTLVGIGLVNAWLMFSQMVALDLVVAAYAIAVKRLGNIFKVLLGALLFNESNFKERMSAGLVMIIGVIFITITDLIPFSWFP
jgi:drug/metabolite transporter (DMT)-like permease